MQRSYDEYVWAFIAMETHALPWPGGKKDEKAVIPYLDLFNHDATSPNFLRLSSDGSRVEVVLGRDHVKGEQIFLNYGCLSNYELATTMGFIAETNPCDNVNLKVNLPPNPVLQGVVEELPAGEE